MSRPLKRLLAAVAAMSVLLLALRGGWQTPAPRYVLIHADDAGMYSSVNRATMLALEHGSVSSASIMVPCPAFAEFAEYAKANADKDFGVHLTLTCETETDRWGPVLPVEQVPSLVDEDGFLWSTSDQVGEHAKLEEAERELRAQVDRAKTAGIRLTHLDVHMFSLWTRIDLLELYVRLGVDYDLPIRYPKVMPELSLFSDESAREMYQQSLEALRSRGFPQADVIDTSNYFLPIEERRPHYLRMLRDLGPGATEIIIHCADDSPGPAPPDAALRQADFDFFTSKEAADEIERLDIRVITWKEFRLMAAAGKLTP